MKLITILNETLKLDSTLRDLIKFVERTTDFEYTGIDGGELGFTTRENGDVSREKFSKVDYNNGVKLISQLEKKYPQYSYKISTAQEWVSIYVSDEPKKVVKPTKVKGFEYSVDYWSRKGSGSVSLNGKSTFKTIKELKAALVNMFGENVYTSKTEEAIKDTEKWLLSKDDWGGTKVEISGLANGKVRVKDNFAEVVVLNINVSKIK
jgi:hypothetical protein